MPKAGPQERTIQARILLRIGALPFCRVWRQTVGRFKVESRKGPDRWINVGIPGMADISGILACGRRVEVEVKSGTGRLRQEQRRWRRMIEAHGGLYVVARTEDEAHEALKDHRRTCEGCAGAEIRRAPAIGALYGSDQPKRDGREGQGESGAGLRR